MVTNPPPQRVIGRRIFDVAEWTGSWYGGSDTVRSQSDNFIFSDDYNLRGPDATQGEQWGKWGSDPEYASWDYDDSTSVLEFWSDTSETDLMPLLWHMTLSWALYGTDIDYNHADLVADGSLQLLSDNGRYPHLASRYSMIGANNSGWQRNRRIFNGTSGNWSNYFFAPQIRTSSEYFYKENRQRSTPQGLRYVGFRGADGWALTAPVRLKHLDGWLVFKPSRTDAEGYTSAYASDWVELPSVGDITTATRALGDEVVSELYIQRESDGQTFSMNAMGRNQRGATWRTDYTLLSAKGERYRFFIQKSNEATWPAEDIEIRFEQLRSRAREEPRRTIVDLRTMERFGASSEPGLLIYPNPADDLVTVVINTADVSSESMPGITDPRQGQASDDSYLEITDNIGSVLMRVPCRSIDVVRCDVSAWPVGTYQAAVVNAAGAVCRQRFSVIR